jgi:hypothetical protein
VTGSGKRRPDGSADFLIWQMGYELKHEDRVEFVFDDSNVSLPTGELFVDETTPETEKMDFFAPMPEDELSTLENRPRLNSACRWKFIAANDPPVSASLDETRQCLHLHILWNEMRPDRMRIHLTKNSLREITSRSGGEDLYTCYLDVGATVEVQIET